MKIRIEPLTVSAFAPFGQVIEMPPPGGRTNITPFLENLREQAGVKLHISNRAPTSLPYVHWRMERHRYSSQAFIPLNVSRYLVVVAPHAKSGGPELRGARAFCARGDQGINYRANAWHAPMAVLDREGQFAVFMWQDGTAADEEFVELTEPLEFDPA